MNKLADYLFQIENETVPTFAVKEGEGFRVFLGDSKLLVVFHRDEKVFGVFSDSLGEQIEITPKMKFRVYEYKGQVEL
jgi:hypothetical protein